MNELTIGQMVYYVPSDSRSKPYWLRINKIGRKWVTLQYNYRMDRVTWEMDGRGYSSPGMCYRSKEEREMIVMRNQRWGVIREHINRSFHAPDWIDLDAVERALGLRSPS